MQNIEIKHIITNTIDQLNVHYRPIFADYINDVIEVIANLIDLNEIKDLPQNQARDFLDQRKESIIEILEKEMIKTKDAKTLGSRFFQAIKSFVDNLIETIIHHNAFA